MKNVTVSLDDGLSEKSREYAAAHGKSFDELVSYALLHKAKYFSQDRYQAFLDADKMGWSITEPILSREERNSR